MRTGLLLTFLLLISVSGFSQKKVLDNTFYCFNNSMRLQNAPVGFEAQAGLAKRLGYDGISGSGEATYSDFRKALDKAGLNIPETYISLTIDSGIPAYNPLLKELIRDSRDRDLLVALHLHSEKYRNNKEEGDRKFAEVLTELADYAREYHVKLAVYPHVTFYCETIDHTLKLVGMVDRPNFGAVFNLCHYLKVEGTALLEEKVLKALPHLFMVSINGTDTGDTQKMDWERLIQPLGNGSFDVYPLVKLLKDHGYKGKFGLQCYQINMDSEVVLTKSMNTWNEFRKRYQSE